ncbi:hypothetical protein vseg_020469 [Gypsophila vaccaria]
MTTLDDNTIFVEILPKLPAKSLMRFKCVSKAFHSAITSSELIDLHLRHHHVSSSDHLLVIGEGRGINCYSLDEPHCLSTPTSVFTWNNARFISVVGSSNGLLCILVSKDDSIHISVPDYVCVLNPTTRIHQSVHIYVPVTQVIYVGFGLDHRTLDHKLVLVYHRRYKRGATRTRITKIYSFNTNSWTEIRTKLLTESFLQSCHGVVINHNLLHWMMRNPCSDKHKNIIGCFDVSLNGWTDDVLLPDYYDNPAQRNFFPTNIGVLDGRLFSCFRTVTDGRFDVWVMREYGVQGSWFRLLKMDELRGGPDVGAEPVFSRGGSDEVLVRHCRSRKLCWYNTTDGKMSDGVIPGTPGVDYSANVCCASLAQLPCGKPFEQSSI